MNDWICCQIGAREHYAVPRSLLLSGCRVHLLTDVWANASDQWWMPPRWLQRTHPGISANAVSSWNLGSLSLAARSFFSRRRPWQKITAQDHWFQDRVAASLPQLVKSFPQPPVVFAYSYAAKRIFETAKSLGCRIVLGQIDPGPVEMRLVQELEQKEGLKDTEWPAPMYWDDWRAECEIADAIVVNSNWSRDALRQEGIPGQRLHVIPLAFENPHLPRESPAKLPQQFTAERPMRILFLGQVILRKGVSELIQAIRLLEGLPVEWTIVGGGEMRLLDELRSLPQTFVAGSVSRQDVAKFYRNADVFILPTHSDGFALTQLEAASWGLPIIASPFCGNVVADGQNGCLLGEVTPQAIFSAVRNFLSDASLVARMRQTQLQMQHAGLPEIGAALIRLASELGTG